MKVVILCGGLGTRLREETEFRPKPMVPIGGRPILWHIMKFYSYYGHKDFILCLGYKGEIIKDYFQNYHWNTSDVTLKLGANPKVRYHTNHDEENWSVTLLDTGLETETGGRLKMAIEHIKDENFLFTYGDGLINSDINKSIKFHLKNKGIATLTAVNLNSRYGELDLDNDLVKSFSEKPKNENLYISGGFFVMNKKISNYINNYKCVLEKESLAQIAKEKKLFAYRHNGFWQCMDTYREQQILEKLWINNLAPWKVWK